MLGTGGEAVAASTAVAGVEGDAGPPGVVVDSAAGDATGTPTAAEATFRFTCVDLVHPC